MYWQWASLGIGFFFLSYFMLVFKIIENEFKVQVPLLTALMNRFLETDHVQAINRNRFPRVA